MKKLMILMAILTVGFTNAQRGDKNVSPEQMASIQSKKMTLALDLDDKQQAKIEKLLIAGAKERQANKMSKEDKNNLTSVQKTAMREKVLDKKITMKREMKNILTASQYERWEKMMAKRAKANKKGKRNRNKKDKRGDRN